MNRSPRILVICNVDIMVWGFLTPLLAALRRAGWEVHVACAKGRHFDLLAAQGFRMWEAPVHRGLNPLRNLRALARFYRLIRTREFDVINTHSPVASAVGRVAAWMAGGRNIVYSVHGFYFHDDMRPWVRKLFVAVEWILGRVTDQFVFVSEEDRRTAISTGIAAESSRTRTIPNGIDLTEFRPRTEREGAGESGRVVGIVGRIVKEKGYREFFEMARRVAKDRRDVRFLVVGDSLRSDRDRFGAALRRMVEEEGLAGRFLFTGHTDEVPRYLREMDVFTLPSYREGLPVSVLEAMATGLPVVATNIRGCREAVVHGETGLLVPVRDPDALTEAALFLLDNPAVAGRMGAAGRQRAARLYDGQAAQERFCSVIGEMLGRHAADPTTVSYASH
jgi:glycosyltransferase involved in cell wall biosynthesis